MKIILPILSLIWFFSSCNNRGTVTTSKDDTSTCKDIFKIDTSIEKVLIDGKLFSFKSLSDRYFDDIELDNTDTSENPGAITLIFKTFDSNKLAYFIRPEIMDNEANSYLIFKPNKKDLSVPGNLFIYITLIANAVNSSLYNIVFLNGKIVFKKIIETKGYFTNVFFRIDKDELFVIEGVWGNEGHYENHKCSIFRYVKQNNIFTKFSLGQTKFKYDIDKNKIDIFNDIKTKEPYLLSSFNLSDYTTE